MAEHSVVGKPVLRVDAKSKATGGAKYTTDVVLPRMLHGKILRSPYPHARIINIDISKAKNLLGVEAVISGKDTAGIRFGFVDTPRYPADECLLAEDKVRYIGEGVAAVAAIDEDTAIEALELIKVEYEELPAVFDPEEAIKDGAPKIHEIIVPTTTCAWEDWGVPRKARPLEITNNIATTLNVSHGDIEQGFRESDYIREDKFFIPANAHVCLEPHDIVASYDPFYQKLDVWLGHMGYEVKRYWLAKTLGLPITKVRTHNVYVGGAFGGKVTLFPHEAIAGFLSMKTGRPVKIVLSRHEVFSATCSDHRIAVEVKTGVKRDGTIMAHEVRIINDCGAYRGSSPVVMFLSYSYSNPIYNVSHIKYAGKGIYTNKSIGNPKRGHGLNQIRFSLDSQIDMIANELGIDTVEMMLKNLRKQGDVLPNGDTLHTYGLPECIRKVAGAIDWKNKRGKHNGRGVGIGLGAGDSGLPYWPFAASAIVRLNHDGTATLYNGAVEFGQGSDTILCQIVAEELGLETEDVTLISNDSELCPMDYNNWLSGGAKVTGEAVRRAAEDVRKQLIECASMALETGAEELEIKERHVYVKEESERKMPFDEIVRYSIQKRHGDPIIGKGYVKAVDEVEFYPSISKGTGRFTEAYAFSAAAAEVEVDRDTGRVKVLKLVLADDCGFDINPINVEGQLESQAIMGLGDTLFEEVLIEKGKTVNPTLADYKIPGALDMPEVETISVQTVDPKGPYGAKEVGEFARGAVPPAIANAVFDAIGARVYSLPITPEKVLEALKSKKE